ncbi:flowering time control protein FPA [Canna indica]|uniref:Flowering time control protein FPA n=1 Tax=Canna indica TaxID=4628 RepID=A0AAQ3KT81_9LILI|nr:flowering time control protein FPA [Canna indica]
MPLSKFAGGPSDHNRRPPLSKEPETDGSPSSTLWVGHLSADTSDADVMAAFGKHGALDCTTMHGSRSYAFVYFRLVDEAKAAKNALNGSAIRGSAIRIEFARPPKAAKQIWIGGFNSSITKQQLEDEFSKFGKIEDYKFFRDRNSAIIEYWKLEDAIAAHKNMNGKCLAGEQLRVDFLRMIPRDLPDRYASKNTYRTLEPLERSAPLDDSRNFHSSSFLGPKRDAFYGGLKDGYPSNILWIGYPPSVQIDEQMLHNAMILFGEIEKIRCFPSRHYSFVEFRSIDEARRAKEGLQGRLFNDPRIQILFSSSDFVPIKDNATPFIGITSHRPETFLDDSPFGPSDLLGPGRPMAPNNLPGSLNRNVSGANMFARPFGQQGIEAHHTGFDFHDFGGGPQNLSGTDSSKTTPPIWGRHSPSAPGILPLPPAKLHAARHVPDGWDEFDMKDAKRLRVDASPSNDGFLRARRADGGNIEERPFPFSPPYRGDSSRNQHGLRSSDKDYSWRGVIAKGGAHVCYARCVAIGKGIDSPLPDIINCSARTGLDMLTEHYAEAIGFEIVFFLPDSEEDFASYTDFLRYLGLRNRAGVAKLEDGTTLFLVPPSDFLTKVLNVNGPERLYGVVLKLPQHSTSTIQKQPQLAILPTLPHHPGQQEASNLQKNYNFISQPEDQGLRVDYNQSLQEEPAHHIPSENIMLPHSDERRPAQPSALEQESNAAVAAAASHLKVSLTPDLIATLASLIPKNTQQSTAAGVHLPSSSTGRPSSSQVSVTHDASVTFQASRQEYQPTMEHQGFPPFGQELSNQTVQTPTVSQFPSYSNIPSGTDQLLQPSVGGMQIQNPALNMSQSPAVLTRQPTSYSVPQGGQYPHQSNQIYQFQAPITSQDNYGNIQTSNASDGFSSAFQQQQRLGSSTHDFIGNMPQPQPTMSLPIDRRNVELPTQGQQLQNALSSSGQETSSDADKNQRYQSTLQFAANLLLQIQQQQQASAQTHGSGNQQ